MSRPIHRRRTLHASIAVAVGLAFAALPATGQASAVLLGTAAPFVVLAGSTATNTGPSVLNGDLGLSPGSALTGFGLPAVVNGATHNTDAVAAQAQSDLTIAYNTAASQLSPVDLTGQNLGGLTLTAGTYAFSSSAQLTGALTLDAAGDPNAQFVFQIGSTLTTASASSVVMINGGSPCNVYWQIGSSATLGSTTAFQGNLMALTSITLNNRASVVGRALARNGAVTLDENVLNGSVCGAASTPAGSPPAAGSPGGSAESPLAAIGPGAEGTIPVGTVTTTTPPAGPATVPTRKGTAILRRTTLGSSVPSGTPRRAACAAGFRATVTGRQIKRVVFSLDGARITSHSKTPFRVFVRALTGTHSVTARVTFKDATRARTLRLPYRACAAAALRPASGPSQFTG
jgi:hypothetical protein